MTRNRVIIAIGIVVLILLGLYFWPSDGTAPQQQAADQQGLDSSATVGAPSTAPLQDEAPATESRAAESRSTAATATATPTTETSAIDAPATEATVSELARDAVAGTGSGDAAPADRAQPAEQSAAAASTQSDGTAPLQSRPAQDRSASESRTTGLQTSETTVPRTSASPTTDPQIPDTRDRSDGTVSREVAQPSDMASTTPRDDVDGRTAPPDEPVAMPVQPSTGTALPSVVTNDAGSTGDAQRQDPPRPAEQPTVALPVGDAQVGQAQVGQAQVGQAQVGEATAEQLVAALPRPEPTRPHAGDGQAEGYPLPSFDIVRISRDCRAVIAGRAMPRSMVIVTLGEERLGQVMADARGEWVLLPDQPLRPGAGEIRLAAMPTDGEMVEGREGVIVAIPDCDSEAGEREIVAVQTDDLGQRPSRILQLPGQTGDGGNLRLDTVDYDETGRLILSGRAEPSARVNIYANNAPVGQVNSDSEGRWSLLVDENVPLGEQLLRLDQVTQRGVVKSRLEFPFSRARFTDLDLSERKVIIQPGNSLWRIARRVYGDGPRFTVIYQANTEQIRNPDLIYPGQIFTLPDDSDSRG